jgi:hypothetical protein
MSVLRLLSHRGLSPAAIVLLLITAMVGGGLEIRPAPPSGCSIATDHHAPDPQPREESADESPEDEEGESAKHAALGSAIAFDRPAARGSRLSDCHGRRAAGARLAAAPIRGPPSLA